MASKPLPNISESEVFITENSPLLGDRVVHGVLESETYDATTPNGPLTGTVAPSPSRWAVFSILSVLLVGVFVANADTTFLLAAYPQIASEFGALAQGPWLLTAYMLAMCAVQPLYGRLSSIFGRKPLLLVSYALYAMGSAACATASTMAQVVAGRAVAGAGAAGMVCLVSILITDLVPLREVAAYRSYVNIVQTVGRSVGAPVGGLVADRLGWRAAFRALVPLTVLGAALVAWRLSGQHGRPERPERPARPERREEYGGTTKQQHGETTRSRLRRVDVVGALLLATVIVLALLAISVLDGGSSGGVGVDAVVVQSSLWAAGGAYAVPAMLALGALQCAAAFVVWETRYAAEPIFPPQLLTRRAVWTSYLLLLLQNTAQAAATLSVPLFFQVTRGEDGGKSGLYLLPSVVGNTLGGLGTGTYVSRTGRYRAAAVLSGLMGVAGYVAMLLRWSDDATSFSPFWDDMWLILAGLATGTAHSAAFMALTAGLSDDATNEDNDDTASTVAIAGSGIYLSGNIGGVVGLTLSSALLQSVLRTKLTQFLDRDTVERVLASVDYIKSLPSGDAIRLRIVSSYVDGFHATFWEALVCSTLTFAVALYIREHVLTR